MPFERDKFEAYKKKESSTFDRKKLDALKEVTIEHLPVRVPGTDIGVDIPVSADVASRFVGLGKGFKNVGQAVEQTLADAGVGMRDPQEVTERIRRENELFERTAPGLAKDYEPVGEIATLAAIPGGGTVKGAMALGGLYGYFTTQEGDTPEARNKDRMMGALITAGAGGTFAKVVTSSLARSGVEHTKKAIQDVINVAKKWKIPFSPSDVASREGARGALTRSLEEFLAKMPIVGGRIQRFAEERGRAAGDAVSDLVDSMVSSNGALRTDVAETIANAAGTHAKKMEVIGSKLWKGLRDEIGDTAIPADKAMAQVDELLGKANDPAIIKHLQTIKERLGKATTYGELFDDYDSVRKYVGDLIGLAEGDASSALGRFVGPLVRVKDALGDDLAVAAKTIGGNVHKRWQIANNFHAKNVAIWKRGQDKAFYKALTGHNKSGDIVSTNQTLSSVMRVLKSGNVRQAKTLFGLLNNSGVEGVRVAVIQEAYEAATKSGAFSPAMFASHVNRYTRFLNPDTTRNAAQKLFFGGAKDAEVRGFVKLMSQMDLVSKVSAKPLTGYRVPEAVATLAVGGALFNPEWWEEAAGIGGGMYLTSLLFTTKAGRATLLKANTAKTPQALATVVRGFAQQFPKISSLMVREFVVQDDLGEREGGELPPAPAEMPVQTAPVPQPEQPSMPAPPMQVPPQQPMPQAPGLDEIAGYRQGADARMRQEQSVIQQRMNR